MNSGLASNADQPYGGKQAMVSMEEPQEHPALNWAKLIFLILLTFGLIVSMWEIRYFFCYFSTAIETMDNHSVPSSYEAAGGLLFGLFCFYVLCFGVAWFFGSKKRD